MKSFHIAHEDEGLRLDRFLARILPNAGRGFLEKMLRKKNIVVNGKKARGNDRLHPGDEVSVYFSDDTFQKFSGNGRLNNFYAKLKADSSFRDVIDIIYEDRDLLILNKPAGILSQRDNRDIFSLNEYMLSYLIDSASLSREDFFNFRPSVMNRLDLNTSGIVLCAKSRPMARQLAEDLADKQVKKTYRALVSGDFSLEGTFRGYLAKDKSANISGFSQQPTKGSKEIASVFTPIRSYDGYSLIEAVLLTGRSHQLRAHLSALGHPILFDPKYGDRQMNRRLAERFHVENNNLRQTLHAFSIVLADGRTFFAPLPPVFQILCGGKD